MSEKPVVDLLVKLNTNFKSALSDIAKLDKAIKNVMKSVESLERRRVTVDLDLSKLDKGIGNLETSVKSIKKIIEDAGAGGKLSKEGIKALTEQVGLMEMQERLQKKSMDNLTKDNTELKETVNMMRWQKDFAKQKEDALGKAAVSEAKIGDILKVEETQAQRMLKITEKMKKALKQPKLVKDALASYKDSAKTIRKDNLPEVLTRMEEATWAWRKGLVAAGSATKNMKDGLFSVAESMASIDTSGMSEKQANIAKELKQASKELLGVYGRTIDMQSRSLAVAQKINKASNLTAEAGAAIATEFQKTFNVMNEMDRFKLFRIKKFPFFQGLQLPHDWAGRMIGLGEGAEYAAEQFARLNAALVNSIGTSLTYVGQFDRRMRYLSRDLYIFSIFARRISQSVNRGFASTIGTSQDLRDSFEDLRLASADVFEPIGETLVPIVEFITGIVEGVGDFIDQSGPLKMVIGVFGALVTIIATVGAAFMGFRAMSAIFVHSTMQLLLSQKKLAATQEDYHRTLFNLGQQFEINIQHLEHWKQKVNATGTNVEEAEAIIKELTRVVFDLQREIITITQTFEKMGGSTAETMDLIAAGGERIRSTMSLMPSLLDLQGIDFEAAVKDIYFLDEGLQGASSSLDRYIKSAQLMESKGGPGLREMGEAFSSLFGKGAGKADPEDVLKLLTDRFGLYREEVGETTEAQQDQTKATRKGSMAVWKTYGALAGFTVISALAAGSAGEFEDATLSLKDAMIELTEPFQGLFTWVANLADVFTDFISGAPDAAKGLLGILAVIGGPLLGVALGKGLLEAGGVVLKVLKSIFLGKAMPTIGASLGKGILGKIGSALLAGFGAIKGALMTTLLGIPILGWIVAIVLAIGGIWLAWKNNWGDIRGHAARFFEWMDDRLAGIAKWLKNIGDAWDKIWGNTKQTVQPFAVSPYTGVLPGDFPEAARGGFVERTGIGLLHKGETVVPSGGRDVSRSSVTNHIYVDVIIEKEISSNIDERQIGRIVSDAIATQLRRRM